MSLHKADLGVIHLMIDVFKAAFTILSSFRTRVYGIGLGRFAAVPICHRGQCPIRAWPS